MSNVVYTSKSHIERRQGPLRIPHLPGEGAASRLRHAGFSCEFQADEKTMLRSKLAFLAPLALIGTASDKDKQGIFADMAWRVRLESAVGEVCAVAAADGAVVDRENTLMRRSVPRSEKEWKPISRFARTAQRYSTAPEMS